MYRDDRGNSTTLGYALNLGTAMLLMTALVVGASTFVENERDRTVQTELEVIGQQVASAIIQTDEMAQTSENGKAVVRRQLPERTAGTAYRIEIESGGDGPVVVESSDGDVTASVELTTQMDIPATTVNGGDITIVYNASVAPNQVEVQSG